MGTTEEYGQISPGTYKQLGQNQMYHTNKYWLRPNQSYTCCLINRREMETITSHLVEFTCLNIVSKVFDLHVLNLGTLMSLTCKIELKSAITHHARIV